MFTTTEQLHDVLDDPGAEERTSECNPVIRREAEQIYRKASQELNSIKDQGQMDKETYEMELEYSNKRKNTSADETELDNRSSRRKCTGKSQTTPHSDSFAARHHDNHRLSDQRREQTPITTTPSDDAAK